MSGRAELRHVSMSGRMHMSEPGRRIEVFTGAGRRRNWSPDELVSGGREARRVAGARTRMVVRGVIEMPVGAQAPEPRPRSRRRSSSSGIELEIDGVAVRVGADASPKAISAVIRALKARS